MKLTTIFNEEIDTTCAGCIVLDNTKFKEGRIHQSKLWDISQDFEIAYPGMIVLSPLRHVSNYAELTSQELQELNTLLIHSKKAIVKIFNCEKLAYIFYEKPNGHIHFVIIPLHGLVEIKDKYSVLSELIAKSEELKSNKDNMLNVNKAIKQLKTYFQNL
jgi:diadenosine tetraphosphate (Ap4A) HIT family hydrolase